MLIKIPFAFMLGLGPRLWKDVDKYQRMVASGTLNAKDEVGLEFDRQSCT